MSDECTCDEDGPYADYNEHPCPFEADVHNNPEDYCSCCEYCTEQCSLSI